MRLCVSFCLTVLSLYGFESVRGSEEEMSENYEFMTTTPDYDYNATFDYYYVTGVYDPDQDQDPQGQAPALSHLTSVLLLGLVMGHMI